MEDVNESFYNIISVPTIAGNSLPANRLHIVQLFSSRTPDEVSGTCVLFCLKNMLGLKKSACDHDYFIRHRRFIVNAARKPQSDCCCLQNPI